MHGRFARCILITLIIVSIFSIASSVTRVYFSQDKDASFKTLFLEDSPTNRLALIVGNVFYEQTIINIGLRPLLRVFDRQMTSIRSAQLVREIKKIYSDIPEDRELHNLPSTIGIALTDILFNRKPYIDSIFAYQKKENASSSKVIFLHGSFGNTKAYFRCLQPIADKTNSDLILPSLGFGKWSRWSVEEESKRGDSLSMLLKDLDSGGVFIAGLSSGAIGALKLAKQIRQPSGIILISPAFNLQKSEFQSLQSIDSRTPILVISGLEDHQTTIDSVRRGVEMLKQHFQSVSVKEIPEEDHFLIFTQRHLLVNDIIKFISPPLYPRRHTDRVRGLYDGGGG